MSQKPTSPYDVTQGSGAPLGNGHHVKDQAFRLGDAVRQRAIATSDAKKSVFADQVGGLVGKLEGIAQPSEGGSENELQQQVMRRGVALLHRLQDTLSQNSTEELIEKAEQQMKQRPGLVVAGCLALGFFGARLLRK
jgi:hypothetical protein